MNSNKTFQIAIDGPVGAGKSTVASLVAKRLGFLFVDTGAMYRAVALGVILDPRAGEDVDLDEILTLFRQGGIPPSISVGRQDDLVSLWNDEEEVSRMVGELEIELLQPSVDDGRKVTVLLHGVDVSWEIRGDLIAEGASIVSQYPVVREVLVAEQRLIAGGENVVMEGRDIGSRVLPEAQLKIYLTANADERVERKMNQLKDMELEYSKEKVRANLQQRDEREMSREIDPLKPVKDAWVFDATGLTIDEVVGRICGRAKEMM